MSTKLTIALHSKYMMPLPMVPEPITDIFFIADLLHAKILECLKKVVGQFLF